VERERERERERAREENCFRVSDFFMGNSL